MMGLNRRMDMLSVKSPSRHEVQIFAGSGQVHRSRLPVRSFSRPATSHLEGRGPAHYPRVKRKIHIHIGFACPVSLRRPTPGHPHHPSHSFHSKIWLPHSWKHCKQTTYWLRATENC